MAINRAVKKNGVKFARMRHLDPYYSQQPVWRVAPTPASPTPAPSSAAAAGPTEAASVQNEAPEHGAKQSKSKSSATDTEKTKNIAKAFVETVVDETSS